MTTSVGGEGIRSASDVPEIREVLQALSEKTYYRIGEVAKITRIKPYVLRFWETEFKTMVPPKSRSKQRMYRRKDLETILVVKHLLYAERFTIEGARKRLIELQRGLKAGQVEPPREGLALVREQLLALRRVVANA
jgi:DNA-binding transcriptional MerR regulator